MRFFRAISIKKLRFAAALLLIILLVPALFVRAEKPESYAYENDAVEKYDAAQFTLADLQAYFKTGTKIGVNTGSIFDRIAEESFPDAERVYFNNPADCLLALSKGMIDGYVTDKPQGVAQCMTDKTVWMPDIVLMEDSYGYAIGKNNEDLRSRMNQTISRLRRSGELAAMAEAWFNIDEAQKPMPEYEYSGENGTLIMSTAADAFPFAYIRNGVPVGYEIELFLRMCKEQGYTPVVEVVEFAGILVALASGKADLSCGSISITPERQEKMLFSEPSYIGGVMVVLPVSMLGGASAADETGFWQSVLASLERTFIRESRWKLILSGLLITLFISICACILGTLLGFGVCMARRSKYATLSIAAKVFIRIVQGTPIVVILMILYYIVFNDANPELVAIIGFSINFAAYVAEMMRTGIEAVDKGQMEAASALGFSRVKTFIYITLPQAARHFLPVFRGEFISLVKMTSVVGYITIQDLTKVSDIIRSRTYESFFPLISTALIYFVMSWLLTSLLAATEKRLDPKRKKRVLKGVSAE